jgi:hypothetical protein
VVGRLVPRRGGNGGSAGTGGVEGKGGAPADRDGGERAS